MKPACRTGDACFYDPPRVPLLEKADCEATVAARTAVSACGGDRPFWGFYGPERPKGDKR
jgi:hypothetical protein